MNEDLRYADSATIESLLSRYTDAKHNFCQQRDELEKARSLLASYSDATWFHFSSRRKRRIASRNFDDISDLYDVARTEYLNISYEVYLQLCQRNTSRDSWPIDFALFSKVKDKWPIGLQKNGIENVAEVILASSRTDRSLREKISQQPGESAEVYWTQKSAEQSSNYFYLDAVKEEMKQNLAVCATSLKQVADLPKDFVLFRTLGLPFSNDRALAFAKSYFDSLHSGDIFRVAAGSSTSCTSLSFLGYRGVLLIIHGVKRGVPLVGKFYHNQINENEIFLVDDIDCKITNILLNRQIESGYNTSQLFSYIIEMEAA